MYLPKCCCHSVYGFRCLELNQLFAVITLSKEKLPFSLFFFFLINALIQKQNAQKPHGAFYLSTSTNWFPLS